MKNMLYDEPTEIDAQAIKRLLLKVYRDFKRGDLTETQAFKEASLLSGILRAIQLCDLEERLNRIERVISE